ncbi:MAG: family 10 glycosylhydrolase [Acidimicrobiia bacterium]|nr:family 10 glycosylhydrolase [Acidimicrobiia bacterium]
MGVQSRSAAVALLLALVLAVGGCSGGDGEASTASSVALVTTTTVAVAPTSSSAPATTSTTAPAVPVSPPSRSVWVNLFDPVLTTRAGVETVIAELAAADVDAVIAQVARRHDAYYDSGYLSPTPDPQLEPGHDVLAALIDAARPHGIQVHAWFVVAPANHPAYDDLVLPAGHVWNEHGPDSADSWMTVDVAGVTSRDHLDVSLPAVRSHAVAIVDDIASRYEVDGVHLDYVRYDAARWGYHPIVLARFHTETGRSDRPDPADPQWVEWRQAQTQALVAEARDALHRARPGAMLSVAVIAGGPGPSALAGGFADTRAAADMMQDWPAWLESGSVDLVFAMAYNREAVPEQAQRFRQWSQFASELSERHPGRIVVGVGAYLNRPADALAQLHLAADATGMAALYSYQQDSADAPRGEVLDAWEWR